MRVASAAATPRPRPAPGIDSEWRPRKNRSAACGASSGLRPGAGVGDLDQHSPFRRAYGHRDRPAAGRELRGVVDELGQDLLDERGVGPDIGEVRCDVQLHPQRALPQRCVPIVGEPPQQAGHAERLAPRRTERRVVGCPPEHHADDAVEAVGGGEQRAQRGRGARGHLLVELLAAALDLVDRRAKLADRRTLELAAEVCEAFLLGTLGDAHEPPTGHGPGVDLHRASILELDAGADRPGGVEPVLDRRVDRPPVVRRQPVQGPLEGEVAKAPPDGPRPATPTGNGSMAAARSASSRSAISPRCVSRSALVRRAVPARANSPSAGTSTV